MNVATPCKEWRFIPLATRELSLADVLPTGQAFRWIRTKEDLVNEWTGVIGKKLYSLTQSDDRLNYVVHNRNESSVNDADTLTEYFQLNVLCSQLISDWSKDIADITSLIPGIRILRQDPVETLVAFICSSNNNIPRISQMVNKLCVHYGTPLGTHCGKSFYTFPTLKELSKDGVEGTLRELGFGYRAKYVTNAAKYILDNHGSDWLDSLRLVSYKEAWSLLQKVPGVGPKVADCVCLMSLDKPEAVPIDTHILQLATREYGVQMRGKSLTLKKYTEIGDMFRERFGHYSGWAQGILFRKQIQNR